MPRASLRSSSVSGVVSKKEVRSLYGSTPRIHIISPFGSRHLPVSLSLAFVLYIPPLLVPVTLDDSMPVVHAPFGSNVTLSDAAQMTFKIVMFLLRFTLRTMLIGTASYKFEEARIELYT